MYRLLLIRRAIIGVVIVLALALLAMAAGAKEVGEKRQDQVQPSVQITPADIDEVKAEPLETPIPEVPAQAPPKRVAVSELEVVRGPSDRPKVSLVINVGAGFTPAEEILDALASRGVRTTFFVMGWVAERNPDMIRRISAAHEVASHGHSVFDLTSVSDAAVIADLERADAVISGITGQSTRPLWSPSAGNRDARVRRLAAQLGYRTILWMQDSTDWREDATADDVRRSALAGAEPGSIIVLHLDSARSRSATAAVLGEVIDTLRQRGLEPVTITELIGE